MTEELKRYLLKYMTNVTGLYAIVITDRDGVVMLKVANDNVPDQATRPPFLSVFGAMSDQLSKLGIGTNKSLISLYEHFQVVQINKYPLLVTMIATNDANTGDILKLEIELEEVFKDLTKVIQMP